MNRRTLLQAILAIPAALLGIKAKAEPARYAMYPDQSRLMFGKETPDRRTPIGRQIEGVVDLYGDWTLDEKLVRDLMLLGIKEIRHHHGTIVMEVHWPHLLSLHPGSSARYPRYDVTVGKLDDPDDLAAHLFR